MEKDVRNRRRNFYINKKFQRNFIIKFCALLAIGAMISGVIIYSMSKATVTTTFENSRLAIKSTADYILPMVLLSSAVMVIVIGIAAILVTLFTSHKIAGPLYRMEKDFREVSAGNLTVRFHTRHDDELKPLVTTLNTFVHNLRNTIDTIEKSVSELESSVNASKVDIPKDIKDRIVSLKRCLERFKV